MRSRIYSFGQYRFNAEANVLSLDDVSIALGYRSALLLRTFLERPGRVISRSELIEVVWRGLVMDDSNLSVQIAALRKILGKPPAGDDWIVTVPRLGYRFAGEVTLFGGKPSAFQVETRPAESPSIAVLPFETLAGDLDKAYFAEGLADDIIDGLSRLRWLLVIARGSSFTYRERAVPLSQIGHELGARYILDGSTRQVGSRMRVSVRLVEAATGFQMWSERYDNEMEGILALQDQITQSVVASLEPHIYAAEGFRYRAREPESLDAWGLVMRAMPYIWTWRAADNETAIELLQSALRIEPGYARANSLLAWAYASRLHTGWSSVSESLALALATARIGVEQDGDDAWGHLALGFSYCMSRQSKPAIEELTASIEINPNFALGHAMLGLGMGYAGNPEGGLDHLSLAVRLSPRDPQQARYLSCSGLCHLVARRFQDAVSFERRAVQLRPHFLGAWRSLSAAAALAGDGEVAKVALAEARRLQPDLSLAWIEEHIPFVEASDRNMYIDGLKAAGLT